MVLAAGECHNIGQQKEDLIAANLIASTVLIDGGLGSYIVGMGCAVLT